MTTVDWRLVADQLATSLRRMAWEAKDSGGIVALAIYDRARIDSEDEVGYEGFR